MSDYEVALAIYTNIIRLVDYDSLTLDRLRDNLPSDKPDDLRSLYGIFVNKKGVCAGYAKALQYLFNRVGFECAFVTGDTEQGHHAWNLAKISGEYYYIDVTWDDSSNTKEEKNYSDDVTYDYFCVTTEEICRDHTPDDTMPLPDCTSLDCNYYYRNNLLIQDYRFGMVRSIIKQKVADGTYLISLKAKNKATYKAMYESLIKENKVNDIIMYLNLDPKTRVSASYAYTNDPKKLILALHLNEIE